MSRIPGVVSAIVNSLDDPAQLGRVQVQFDWMDGAPQSYWARVAAPMAGSGRGAFFMPELNDEVLVSFDQGDVSSAYIVGYCWSSADKPPFSANLKQRGIQSVLGHQFIMDDDPQTNKITLTTPNNGYALTLDAQNEKITVVTEAGVSVELDDPAAGGPQISLTLPTGDGVVLNATGLNITIATGTLNVTALSATITAPSVTIDAAATTITGVLTVAGPVIAGGVVSPTYTEGVGNFL
ncbi:MAG TPA: phage baseplate assembly protein V [Candidatus Acidoferrales bacterium]|nr:phage baseplate assembly protein V [Candidatus Acidoferrales bacterium]